MRTSAKSFEFAIRLPLLLGMLAIRPRGRRPPTRLKCSVLQRAVEVDGRMRAIAKRLVVGVAATAQRHLVWMRDLSAVDVRQMHRPADEVRTVFARGDVDFGHFQAPSTGSHRDWCVRPGVPTPA